MELIWTQPGFKYCNQPLSLFNPLVRRHLGIDRWEALYEREFTPTFERYFRDICDGRVRFANPNPLRGHYRPVTHRIVFKEIHGCADRIDWFRDTFDARVAYLLRHPIAVAISSERFPLLDAFLETDYRDHFSHEQLAFADRIASSRHAARAGGAVVVPAERGPPARGDRGLGRRHVRATRRRPRARDRRAGGQARPAGPRAHADALTVPSVNVKIKSSEETQHLLYETPADRRPDLVDKWRRRVDANDEARAMEILDAFELDVYTRGEVFPADRAWLPAVPGRRASRRAVSP